MDGRPQPDALELGWQGVRDSWKPWHRLPRLQIEPHPEGVGEAPARQRVVLQQQLCPTVDQVLMVFAA